MDRLLHVLVLGLVVAPVAEAGLLESGVSRLSQGGAVARGGSHQCGACHSSEFALWVRHPHSRALIDPELDPRRIPARWGKRVRGWQEFVEGRFEPAQVALAFGVARTQVYFRKGDQGHRLLPALWDLVDRRWMPLPPELEGFADTGGTWEAGCAGCHTTGYQPAERAFDEMGVGCQACHGDGSAHMASAGKAPVTKPGDLEPKRSAEVCGACHSRGADTVSGAPYAARYRIGDVLGSTFRVTTAENSDQDFWPGGVERRPYMEYQGFVQSAHFQAGLHCGSCHLPHGSQYGAALVARTDDLCGKCHAATTKMGPVHRRHRSGAGCVDCHMSVANPGTGVFPVRTHTLRFLEPERAVATGMPSSCTSTCHAEADARWAARVVKEWRARP